LINQKSKRIGVDIDGVIRNLYIPLVSYFDIYHHDVEIDPISEWTNYKIWNHFRRKGKPVDEKWFKDIWFVREAQSIYKDCAYPYPYAAESLDYIKSMGHKIVLISAQPNRLTMGLTIQWLRKRDIQFDEIHFTDYDSKAKVNCDIYIEDSPYQAGKIADHYGFSSVWIYNQPWNNSDGWHSFCKRWYSWPDMAQEIKERYK
jgi:uncharacterized HAD superfamily protein